MQNTFNRFPFVVVINNLRITEFQQTPNSLICFVDKDIAGTEYISTDRLYDSCNVNTADIMNIHVCNNNIGDDVTIMITRLPSSLRLTTRECVHMSF